jgi:outer membrane protein assembly factor BamD
MKLLYRAVMLIGLLSFPSCVHGKKNLRKHKNTYLENVKLNFEAGEKALANNDYDKAITHFQFVRSNYPFSKYAALSDLRTADVKFAQKKWIDAAAAYEVFIRLHPRHEKAIYSSYRLGVSYFNAVPRDFFLFPPATSRDQSFTKEALRALERFILQFPYSEYTFDAIEKRGLLFSYLAQHNQHIAKYYVCRKRYLAAINRYLLVNDLYPETKESAESLFLAAEIYRQQLENRKKAMELYEKIIEEKKGSPYAEQGKIKLKELTSDENKNL